VSSTGGQAQSSSAARTSARRAAPEGGSDSAASRTVEMSREVEDREGEPRRVRLTLTRVNPLSVMKIAFLLSVALGIAGVVVMAVIWMMLNGMGVFSAINDALNEFPTGASGQRLSVAEYMAFGRVVSLSVVFGFVNVILMTSMATLMAFIYNLCAALVGGLSFTLSDD
jgi:uncharacterized membrane protein